MPSHLPYSFQKKAIQLVLLRVWWKNCPGYWVKTWHASQGDIVKTVYFACTVTKTFECCCHTNDIEVSLTRNPQWIPLIPPSINILINTPLTSWSTDGRHSANYQSSVNRAPTKWDVGQVSIKMLMAGWSKISINTQPRMPFLHLIRLFEVER